MKAQPEGGAEGERQITAASHGHMLSNINAWTCDSEWLVYDERASDDEFSSQRIAMAHVATGEIRPLYESSNGARCGVVTASPVESKVVFIAGPEHPTPDWSYGFTRRRGLVVDARRPGVARPLDAMTYAPPFVPGALRGGTHLHVFSPDGAWASFTYEDNVLAGNPERALPRDYNQRAVGVAVAGRPVRVSRTHPRNHDGDYFSLIVTRVTRNPRAGSDDISRASEEGWIGQNGYARPDGSRQRRALAFQGVVTAANGAEHAEVFVVDLPDSLLAAGENGGPLQGSELRYPAPPRGVVQRRVTFTAERKFPGVARGPRHWVRSSPDGSRLVFLMRDDSGRVQFWSISPNGGALRQVSDHAWSVASAFTWSPDGTRLAHVMDNSVFLTEAASGRALRLTARTGDASAPQPHACVFSPDGKWVAFTRKVTASGGAFAQIFCVAVPPV